MPTLPISRYLLTGVLSMGGGSTGAAAQHVPDAILVEMADIHSAYDRMPQLLAEVDATFSRYPGVPHAILIDGDLFEAGNVVGRRTGGTIEFAFLRALVRRSPTIFNLGNHESEFFGLAETVARLRAAGATIIGGTIKDRATGQPFTGPATEIRLGNRLVRIVGFATDRLPTFRFVVRPTLALDDPVRWARENLGRLMEGTPVAIVMSHAGLAADRQIIPSVPDGTLFVGAHDHLTFVQAFDRSVYFQAGSWGATLATITLRTDPMVEWNVETRALDAAAPADVEFAEFVRTTIIRSLTPEETTVIGRSPQALNPEAAARFAAEAARRAAAADVAVIGGTTFGAGLPAGDVTRYALDACVRFESPLFVGEVSGSALQRIFARANQGPATPFAERSGENLVLVGPATIDPMKTYRLVTTDWIAATPRTYLGSDAPTFNPVSGATLKKAVLGALAGHRRADLP